MNKNTQVTQLAAAILEVKTLEEVIDFLKGLLTPKELAEIAQRVQIVKKLKQGIPQRKISEELGVGIATITRGSKELKKGRFKNV